jgi:hypothetical protein
MIGPAVNIGNRCKIQNNVSIYAGVELEDEVFCGPSCVFTNVNNPRSAIERKHEFARTLVKRGASIGANATIVCGDTVGRCCRDRRRATIRAYGRGARATHRLDEQGRAKAGYRISFESLDRQMAAAKRGRGSQHG